MSGYGNNSSMIMLFSTIPLVLTLCYLAIYIICVLPFNKHKRILRIAIINYLIMLVVVFLILANIGVSQILTLIEDAILK